MGLDIKLGELILPDMQINIYGTSNNTCVIGEVETRAGVSLLNELKGNSNNLKKNIQNTLEKRNPCNLHPITNLQIN